jgi:hypothetical protein
MPHRFKLIEPKIPFGNNSSINKNMSHQEDLSSLFKVTFGRLIKPQFHFKIKY